MRRVRREGTHGRGQASGGGERSVQVGSNLRATAARLPPTRRPEPFHVASHHVAVYSRYQRHGRRRSPVARTSLGRLPAELPAQLRVVEQVAPVVAGPVGHDRLQDSRLPGQLEHHVGDLLDRLLDAAADVVGLAEPPALEHELDRRGSGRATCSHSRLFAVDAYSGNGRSSSALVTKSGITFSGNWYGP